MKRIKYLLYVVFLSVIMIGRADAASVSVTANSTNVTVGSTVKVTVTVKDTGGSAGKVGAWEYCVSYDSSLLTLTGSTSNSGGACVNDGVYGVTSEKATFTFKAKASGSSTVSVKNVALYDYATESLMEANAGSVTIKAKTQAEIQASYSKNDDLKNLSVTDYQISPAFDKDTLEYSLEVENEVDKITINAERDDNRATVSGTGEKNLLEGINKFEIVVTAEKGNKKTYVLNVTRKELNPIIKKVEGLDYSIVRKAEGIEAPSYYTLETATIDGEEVPAWKSEITKYTLVALKNGAGDVKFFRYNNGEFIPYIQFTTEAFTFIAEETSNRVKGFDIEKDVFLGDKKVKGYVSNKDSEYVLVYGMNASNGEAGWYIYDTKDKLFQRYNSEIVSVKKEEGLDLYFILTIVFAGVSAVSILLIIILMMKNSKIRKKNEKLVDIVENRREQREQKIAERFDSISDLEDDELKKLEETIKLQRELNATKKLEIAEEIEEKEENKAVIEETEEELNLGLEEDSSNEEVEKVTDPEEALLASIAKANDKSFNSEDEIKIPIETDVDDETNNIAIDVNIEDIMEENSDEISKKASKRAKKSKKNVPIIEEETEEVLPNKEQEPVQTEEISFTQKLIEEPVGQSLSKREIRRLEKLRKQEEKEELRKMQEDFFKTNEYEIEDNLEVKEDFEETTEMSTKNRKRK